MTKVTEITTIIGITGITEIIMLKSIKSPELAQSLKYRIRTNIGGYNIW